MLHDAAKLIWELIAKRDDLLDGHNKYSSDPTKGCVPMTDYLRVKKERDALRAKVLDLEHDLADCRNGLANSH
jgi:hypothetical protein